MSKSNVMTGLVHRELRTQFHAVLVNEMSERKNRRGMVTLSDGRTELEWVWEERAAMWREVERERRLLGKPPLTIADVEFVESQAAGHSDYASKFAAHCACLVLDIDPRPW